MENNEFKGFSLFNDIEDKTLQSRNRAVVLANITDAHKTKDNKISPKGVSVIFGYFQNVPKEDREEVLTKYSEFLNERGWKLV